MQVPLLRDVGTWCPLNLFGKANALYFLVMRVHYVVLVKVSKLRLFQISQLSLINPLNPEGSGKRGHIVVRDVF